MTKQEFKQLWESDSSGGGITFDDIAHCALQWCLFSHPRTAPIDHVRYQVLKAANTKDAEDYNPEKEKLK